MLFFSYLCLSLASDVDLSASVFCSSYEGKTKMQMQDHTHETAEILDLQTHPNSLMAVNSFLLLLGRIKKAVT